ncbi:MAG: BlaI/MecI/CopY family transcriptional regulator [Gemmiger sp.]|uniref:BlaI/MecI/CopY family transcriptional regulator n=1 Tax=Gemmiger sp. TaxID=2049027 RepID=UPI002E76AC7F|nr:BlaI/MecI/CopY family transcriptional regulator [Gemmiger sp.]MEE1422421.1 BlaI/MecI/CopY family transcriptional regulator [Gemmiger sp.]
MHLTKSEQQIMEIFWKADHAMAQTEVVSTCVERKWKERSIFSMLNSLMEKGVLREVCFVRSGKTYARTFEPAMSHAEYSGRAAARKAAAGAARCVDAEDGNDPCDPEGDAGRPARKYAVKQTAAHGSCADARGIRFVQKSTAARIGRRYFFASLSPAVCLQG